MRKEIRTFVAVKIHPGKKLLEQFAHFKRTFKQDRINWVDTDNFHLTLRFVGSTTREQLYKLVDRFELIATELKSFELKVNGAGYFKSKGQPRVLFVKVDEPDELSELVRSVEQEVVACGFHGELKNFRPHLTLGRIKQVESRARFFSLLEELPETEYQKEVVKEFILYQSILRPEGPLYKPIRKFKLQ